MSYQALYRVWRPQRFEDIAGQTAVTRTLKNALMQGKSSHAYLFTGPRGTGKTSAAKIFAKAINCPNQEDGEPCNHCHTCLAITEGRLNDVIEIDAASNNGVEEIRDIRDKARYAPTQAEYKVYIIDEVHMLSTGAFNALLKTLEEPPEKVIFILATTEPHKIPLTIISRTQRFDFKRITYQDIIARMIYILDQEKIAYEEEALHIVARAANGGMRDALSLLDQIISYDSELVSFDHAVQVSGSLTEDMMLSFLSALSSNQAEEALQVLHDILEQGKEAGRFLEEMILFVRDLLVYKQTEGKGMQDADRLTDRFREFSQAVEAEFLYRAVETFSKTQTEMRFSTQPDVYLEVLAVKLSRSPAEEKSTKKLVEVNQEQPAELIRLEKEVSKLKSELASVLDSLKNGTITVEGLEETSVKRQTPQRQAPTTFRADLGRAQQIMRDATKPALVTLQESWTDILDDLSITQRAVLRQAEPVAANEDASILAFEYDILCQKATEDMELQVALDASIQKMIKRPGEVVCVTVEQWASLRRQYVADLKAGKIQPKQAETNNEIKVATSELPEPPPFDDYISGSDEEEREEAQQEEVVEQAISIFGKENVTIINE